MKVLLVGSAVSVPWFDHNGRLPNLGLSSIAGNLDQTPCEVKILDLIVAGRNPHRYFQRVLRSYQPDVVGFSCMVFQYHDTLELARITKHHNARTIVVLGGYYPTVDYDVILESDAMDVVDYVVRNEGEIAFRALIETLIQGEDVSQAPNLSYLLDGSVRHNPTQDLEDLDMLRLPDRSARLLKKGFHAFGHPADVIETTRGCVFDCNFCSVLQMYGKSFRRFSFDRVIADIRDAQQHGARTLILADDNITLDGKRFKALCEAIIDAGLNKITYFVQASVQGLRNTPGLAETMVKAGFRWVYLGVETESDEALDFFQKSNQFKSADVYDVVQELKGYGAIVFGGLIIGHPDDTEESIRATYAFAKHIGLDVAIFLPLMPLPKTPIRDILMEEGLVTNPYDYARYTGFDACVKTRHLSAERLAALREELGFRYPVDSGSLWRLIKAFPALFFKHYPFKIAPREIVPYIKKGIRARRRDAVSSGN